MLDELERGMSGNLTYVHRAFETLAAYGFGKPTERVDVTQNAERPSFTHEEKVTMLQEIARRLGYRLTAENGQQASSHPALLAPPVGPTAPQAGHCLLFRGTRLFVRLSDAGTYELWQRHDTGDDELIWSGEFPAVLAKAAELAEHGPWLPDEWVVLDQDGQRVS